MLFIAGGNMATDKIKIFLFLLYLGSVLSAMANGPQRVEIVA